LIKVKICGTTCTEDAQLATEAGADALGFVFFRDSPRFVEPEDARRIIETLPPFVTAVGVFVDETPDAVAAICWFCGIHVAQLHGDEGPDQCIDLERDKRIKVIKAFRPRRDEDLGLMGDYHVNAFLMDAWDQRCRGGTGRTGDWALASRARAHGPIILAGGLCPDNVGEAVAAVRPYGVDVSTGVEREPGRKDKALLRAFVRAAREGEERSCPDRSAFRKGEAVGK